MIKFSPILAWVIYHFSNNPTILNVKLTCFSKRAKMDDAQLNGWQTIGNIAMLLNLIGEALPQLIIRYVLLYFFIYLLSPSDAIGQFEK